MAVSINVSLRGPGRPNVQGGDDSEVDRDCGRNASGQPGGLHPAKPTRGDRPPGAA